MSLYISIFMLLRSERFVSIRVPFLEFDLLQEKRTRKKPMKHQNKYAVSSNAALVAYHQVYNFNAIDTTPHFPTACHQIASPPYLDLEKAEEITAWRCGSGTRS